MKSKIITLLAAFLAGFLIHTYYDSTDSQSNALTSQNQWYKSSFNNLYTIIHITLNCDSATAQKVEDSLALVFTEFTTTVQANSTLDSLIFNAPLNSEIALTPVLYDLFAFGAQKFIETNGAINVGIGNLLRTYGLMWNMKPHLPTPDSIVYETERMSTLFYSLNSQNHSIKILRTGEHFALGSFSKGKALDLAIDIFNHFNVANYLLEVGGDIVYAGINPKGVAWTVGVQDPNAQEGMTGVLQLKIPTFNSMATSGGYQKYFVDAAGKKHHHILNPKTGYSITDKKSVTVLSKGGMETDFWATYLFVLPLDSAKYIVEHSDNLEAVIIDSANTQYISPNLLESYRSI